MRKINQTGKDQCRSHSAKPIAAHRLGATSTAASKRLHRPRGRALSSFSWLRGDRIDGNVLMVVVERLMRDLEAGAFKSVA